MRRITLQIMRGNKIGSDFVPQDGELVYAKDTKELIVGNGEAQVSELKGVKNIVKAPNGRLYSVEVNNFGNAKATPLMITLRGRINTELDLYAD